MLQRKARLTKTRRGKILACFAHDLTATQTSNLLGVNGNTANRWYRSFREQIPARAEITTPSFSGEIELDESYFGGIKKKTHAMERRKRGRGAEHKVPVFGVLKRDGKVYTQVIKNASKQELLPIARKIVKQQSTIYTDKWKAYDGYKHYRINHSTRYSDRKGTHVNGTPNFWSFAKRRLAKFNGVSRDTFLLHLKETEFRYNHKGDILRELKRIMRL